MFLTCLFSFLFLYIIIDIFSRLEDILKQKIGFEILFSYYSSYLPIIFLQVGPLAGLLATLYTFGKLNKENEVIAMRASGLSVVQITKTLIIFGAIISLFNFWVGDKLVPRALAAQKKFILRIDKGVREKENRDIDNLCMYGQGNRLIFVSKFSIGTGTMEGITILEHDERQNITKKIVANKGVYKERNWTFYQSITYDFDENGQIRNEPVYREEEVMRIPETPRDFFNQRQQPDSMTIAQLDNYLWKLSKSGATGVIRNLKVDYYQRFTSPLMAAIMIMLGIPFSLMLRKRATGMSSLGVSIMMGFFYYVVNAVSIALGKAGVFPPLLAASFSHIVFLSIAVYLIVRTR